MNQNLICPICGKQLGMNERLTIGHDAIGSLIVHHEIPELIPLNTTEDVQTARDKIDKANKDNSLHYGPWRNYCGSAGYSTVEII